jgi:hypothetical protein
MPSNNATRTSQSRTNLRTPTGNKQQPQQMQPQQMQPQQMQPQQMQSQQMQSQQMQTQQMQPQQMQPQQMQPQQMQMQMMPGNQNLAEKLSVIVPPYVMKRIFANIDKIKSLVMGGEWNKEDFKSSLKNEIQELTINLKSPELQVAIKELTEAADVPLTVFVEKFTEIFEKHVKDITNKLSNVVVNLVGEIPGVNVVTNTVLAASNAVHVAKNVTELGKELVDSLQKFKNDMTSVVEKFNPTMNQQFGQQMMQPLMAQMPQQLPFSPQRQWGGSKSGGPHNMKEAKKHLHHLHRKKNRTLRRIHHSINQFLTSNHNKRSIKAKTKTNH